MPRYICKLDNRYFEWSTVVDAPVTYLMSLEQFREYYEREYGRSSMIEFQARIQRADQKGTSDLIHDSIDELIPKRQQKKIIKNF